METEGRFALGIQTVPVSTRSLQKSVGAYYVCLNERSRAADGAIHVRFGGKVHDCVGLVFAEHARQFAAIADIDLFKAVSRIVRYGGQ